MTGDERPGATVIGLEPRRLREGQGTAAAAVRLYHADTASTSLDEAEHWRRLASRLDRRAGGLAWRFAAASLATGAAVALLVFSFAPRRDRSVVAVSSPRPILLAASEPTPTATVRELAPVVHAGPRVALSRAPRALPVGASDLGGEAHAELAPGGRAVVTTDGGNTRVSLVRGALALDVEPRPPGRRFAVEMGPYRFVIAGASFRIARSDGAVDVRVTDGRVDVWRGEHPGPVLTGGDHWSGALPEEAPANIEVPAEPSAAPAETLAPCEAAVGAGSTGDALRCYLRVGGGAGLAAELALYEAARLQLRTTGDVKAALDTLGELTRRFPKGTLREEVELTMVEWLPRAGEHRRALELSERLLRAHPGDGRARELHLLRGNILREALGDCAQAEPEYGAAVDGAGRTGDDAAFYRAVCLEILGRAPEAIAAYDGYLARPRAIHAAEAKARVSTLRP